MTDEEDGEKAISKDIVTAIIACPTFYARDSDAG
jgi:hypothetical protein